jgi:hypothetical protein
MIKPLDEYTPEERKFVEWVESVRNRPPRPGFPRRTLEQMAREQGVGPIKLEELEAIVREADEDDDEDAPQPRFEGER